jgi:hypothetical protein
MADVPGERAMNCCRCNIRFDIPYVTQSCNGNWVDVSHAEAVRGWNEVCRRLRERPFE